MKVLIVKTSSMGDVIHTFPAVEDAHRSVPGLTFDWCVEEAFADIVGLHPGIGTIHGRCARSQARASWPGVTPFSSAIASSRETSSMFRSMLPAWKRGQLRLLKVASRRFGVLDGALRLDVFVKYAAGGHAWWQAEEKVMRVPQEHYAAHDAIAWRGATLRAPRDHARYLALKYGDWRTPVRDWQAGRDEKTIVGDA